MHLLFRTLRVWQRVSLWRSGMRRREGRVLKEQQKRRGRPMLQPLWGFGWVLVRRKLIPVSGFRPRQVCICSLLMSDADQQEPSHLKRLAGGEQSGALFYTNLQALHHKNIESNRMTKSRSLWKIFRYLMGKLLLLLLL